MASPIKRFFFGRVFPFVFLATGVLTLVWAVNVLREANASATWPSVDGVITSTAIESRTSSRSGRSKTSQTTHAAHARYTYEVGGTSFEGDRIAFDAGHASGDQSKAQAIAARYPTGKLVKVFYCPEDPSRSVLNPGIQSSTWGLVAVGSVFFLVGLAGMIFMPRVAQRF